jgi:hypothetical protein
LGNFGAKEVDTPISSSRYGRRPTQQLRQTSSNLIDENIAISSSSHGASPL